MIKAFLFDLNGTMIDDMEYHAKAWSDILNNDLQDGLSYAEVKEQMYGKNDELLVRIFGEHYFLPEKMKELSIEKERQYQRAYKPDMKLIDGLHQFLEETKAAGILMAIGSAAIPFNIDFVLDSLGIRHYFDAIVSADDVAISKPDPETYIKGAALLGVTPAECIVFEDAPKGVEAAKNAGMQSVVLTTMHGMDEFEQYENTIAFIDDYTSSSPSDFV
ncbi:MAG: HAD family phosphatase [Panacibacter sp.]